MANMTCTKKERDELVVKYLPLVRRVAGKIEVKDNNYEKEDLVNIGVIGLMDAIERFDDSKNVPFEAYATLRIKGTIMDELRKTGRVSRDRIYKLNEYYNAKEELENRLKRTHKESEICQELGIGKKELQKIHETVHYLSETSLESVVFSDKDNDLSLMDMVEDDHAVLPEEHVMKVEHKRLLKEAISQLKEREKIILNLYYVEELTLKEIAHILDISIPRVSQIHGKVLMKLRNSIASELGEADV